MHAAADHMHERSRRYGIREGAFQAVMQGGGENYLSAFALLLHANPLQIGLLSALPQLAGTWSQLLSVKALHRLQHRKTVILAGAACQAATWLPLILLPQLLPDQGPWLLIVCAMVYMASGHFAIPAWNSLITDLVDPNQRGSYFARRAKLMAMTSFAALCSAGLILQWAQSGQRSWVGFAMIFLIAASARIMSAWYLAGIDDPPHAAMRETKFSLLDFLRHEHSADFRRFLWFSGLMHVCVLISGPYFVVYMLRDLHFSYWMYTTWLAAGVLGQFLTLHPWGQLADRFGTKKLLMVTGMIVPFLPMFYLVSTNFFYLLVVNFAGGVIWAGLSLGLQNYVFDAVRPQDRAKGVALSNTINALGWFVGAMLGGWLASAMPEGIAAELHQVSTLPLVFFISGMLRLVVSLGLLRTFRETRTVESISRRQLMMELPLLKPLTEVFVGRESRQ